VLSNPQKEYNSQLAAAVPKLLEPGGAR